MIDIDPPTDEEKASWPDGVVVPLEEPFADDRGARTLRFVAFVNEEPPYFWTDEMGSVVYAQRCRENNEDIVAMLALETIGYYRDEPGSQVYPALFRFFYPDRGNFLGFVSDFRSRRQMRRAAQAFRAASDFPLVTAAVPRFVPGVSWSDHRSFWRRGYPAFMVTDTALYRYPHYHTAQDTPEKLAYPEFARATDGLARAFAALATDKS